MVSTSTTIAVCVTLLITLIGPLVLYIVYGVKNKGKGVWMAGMWGAAGFLLMQVIIRMPMISTIQLAIGYEPFMAFVENNYILYCFIMAFTAGLFEVIGRYAVAKMLKKNLTYTTGVAAGIGHGGIEAVMIVGMTYISNLLYIFMINTNTFDPMVEQTAAMGVDASSLVALKDSLINTGAGLFYLAGYERVLTVCAHIAMSLLVCYFVWKKKDLLGILICLAIHTALDFGGVVLNSLSTEYLGAVVSETVGYVLTYTFLTAVAVASIVFVCKLKKCWVEPEEEKEA